MVVPCKVFDWEGSEAVSFPSGESDEDGKEADQEASCRAASRAFERMTGYQLTERMKASIVYACSCVTNSGTGQPTKVFHYHGLELGKDDYEKIRCFTPESAQLRRDTKVRIYMHAFTDAMQHVQMHALRCRSSRRISSGARLSYLVSQSRGTLSVPIWYEDLRNPSAPVYGLPAYLRLQGSAELHARQLRLHRNVRWLKALLSLKLLTEAEVREICTQAGCDIEESILFPKVQTDAQGAPDALFAALSIHPKQGSSATAMSTSLGQSGPKWRSLNRHNDTGTLNPKIALGPMLYCSCMSRSGAV